MNVCEKNKLLLNTLGKLMIKTIKQEKGTFEIEYLDVFDTIENYDENNFANFIKIYFYPKTIMNEVECIKYTNEFVNELKNEVDEIIKNNFNFFKNFKITFSKKFSGFSFVPHKKIKNYQVVTSATYYITIKLLDN